MLDTAVQIYPYANYPFRTCKSLLTNYRILNVMNLPAFWLTINIVLYESSTLYNLEFLEKVNQFWVELFAS